jgi:uncharacterized DUF497 family protein
VDARVDGAFGQNRHREGTAFARRGYRGEHWALNDAVASTILETDEKVPIRYNSYTLRTPEGQAVCSSSMRSSRRNKEKHGIDFEEAQALWLDEMLVEIPARTEDEPRFLVVGRIGDAHWSAVITYRDDRIRIISVRRARDEEVALYGGE